MISEEDLKTIVDTVMQRIGSSSKTIDQLAPVEAFDASAFMEISGGRKISASVIADAIGKLFLYKYVDNKVAIEGSARRNGDNEILANLNRTNEIVIGLNKPATSANNGYMTSEQATQLLDLVGETLIGEATTSSFSISLERSLVLDSDSVEIPVHNGAQRCPALLLPSDFEKIKSNESAINAQGAVISKISKDVTAALNTNLFFLKMGPRVLGLSMTNGNGPVEGAGIDLPVHGGLDGQTHCDWPALITPEQFNQFELLVSNAPFEFSRIESIPAEAVQNGYAPSDSHYIYNDNTNTFVTASQDDMGRITYYQYSHKNYVSGYGPVPGRTYIEKYFNRVFVGVNNGLSEIFQTVEIP